MYSPKKLDIVHKGLNNIDDQAYFLDNLADRLESVYQTELSEEIRCIAHIVRFNSKAIHQAVGADIMERVNDIQKSQADTIKYLLKKV